MCTETFKKEREAYKSRIPYLTRISKRIHDELIELVMEDLKIKYDLDVSVKTEQEFLNDISNYEYPLEDMYDYICANITVFNDDDMEKACKDIFYIYHKFDEKIEEEPDGKVLRFICFVPSWFEEKDEPSIAFFTIRIKKLYYKIY